MSSYSSYSSRGQKPRDSYRPRGSFSNRSFAPKALASDRDLTEGLSTTALQTITKVEGQSSDKEVKISDFQYIGSYNWVDASSPTIIVPGKFNMS